LFGITCRHFKRTRTRTSLTLDDRFVTLALASQPITPLAPPFTSTLESGSPRLRETRSIDCERERTGFHNKRVLRLFIVLRSGGTFPGRQSLTPGLLTLLDLFSLHCRPGHLDLSLLEFKLLLSPETLPFTTVSHTLGDPRRYTLRIPSWKHIPIPIINLDIVHQRN
jgi:hypothetical protein